MAGIRRAREFERDLDAVDRLKPIAEKYDLTVAELAMKFVVTNPVVSTTIPGARNREQLEQNVAAAFCHRSHTKNSPPSITC